ncbi:unnamed protein product [Boreogadus saida]
MEAQERELQAERGERQAEREHQLEIRRIAAEKKNPSSPASRTTDSRPRSTTTALIGHQGGPTSDLATWSIGDCSKLFWHLVGR